MPDSYSRLHPLVRKRHIPMPLLSLQQPLALQKTGNALGNGMGELGEFVARRCLDPAKPGG